MALDQDPGSSTMTDIMLQKYVEMGISIEIGMICSVLILAMVTLATLGLFILDMTVDLYLQVQISTLGFQTRSQVLATAVEVANTSRIK